MDAMARWSEPEVVEFTDDQVATPRVITHHREMILKLERERADLTESIAYAEDLWPRVIARYGEHPLIRGEVYGLELETIFELIYLDDNCTFKGLAVDNLLDAFKVVDERLDRAMRVARLGERAFARFGFNRTQYNSPCEEAFWRMLFGQPLREQRAWPEPKMSTSAFFKILGIEPKIVRRF